jgi:hypothetical protein
MSFFAITGAGTATYRRLLCERSTTVGTEESGEQSRRMNEVSDE